MNSEITSLALSLPTVERDRDRETSDYDPAWIADRLVALVAIDAAERTDGPTEADFEAFNARGGAAGFGRKAPLLAPTAIDR